MSDEDERTELEDEIDAEQARSMIAGGKARAIDVRDPEKAAGGHIPGAAIPQDDDIAGAVETALAGMELPLLVFADDDERSREVAEQLRGDGHDAAAVSGGISAWSDAGGQLQPGTDEEYKGPKLKQPGG